MVLATRHQMTLSRLRLPGRVLDITEQTQTSLQRPRRLACGIRVYDPVGYALRLAWGGAGGVVVPWQW